MTIDGLPDSVCSFSLYESLYALGFDATKFTTLSIESHGVIAIVRAYYSDGNPVLDEEGDQCTHEVIIPYIKRTVEG